MDERAYASDWLFAVRQGVEERLSAFFREERARLCAHAPEAAELVDAIDAFTTRGGKRLRPALAFAAFKSVRPGGSFAEIADAGAALELLQSYLLVHDDWMDGDDERRGGPSVHAAFRARHGDAHLGSSLAILAGDLAAAMSWRLLARCAGDPARLTRALEVMLRMHEEVIIGQTLDVLHAPDVARMQQLKTGSYTVRGPLDLGAVLAGADDEQRALLARFGVPLGAAFQMRDDLLGAFGDPRETGKPAGNDLRAGKHTALIQAAEERCARAELAPIYAVLGRVGATDEDVGAALSLLESCGARADVEARLRALHDSALATLEDAPLFEPGLGMLRELAAKLTMRSR